MGEWKRLWREECGAVVTTELILIGTIVALGLIPAYVTLRNALVLEFYDSAACVSAYDRGCGWWGNDNDRNGHDDHADGDGHSHDRYVHATTAGSMRGH